MVHETAIVHPGATLGKGVTVGPYAVIGEGVEIGDETEIGPHVVLEGPTVIGRRNRIGAGSCLGGAPQDVRYRGEPTRLYVGDDNVIREHVTIHRGTPYGRQETVVGNGCYIMSHVHIGHDCIIGNDVILTHGAALAGFVEVEDGAVVGGLTGFHQFVRVGARAMVAGCSRIVKDVPPFMTVAGTPGKVHGLNAVGLRRSGMSLEQRRQVKEAYRLLYRSGLNVSQAVERLLEHIGGEEAYERLVADVPSHGLVPDPIAHIIRFIRGSRRGLSAGASGPEGGQGTDEERSDDGD